MPRKNHHHHTKSYNNKSNNNNKGDEEGEEEEHESSTTTQKEEHEELSKSQQHRNTIMNDFSAVPPKPTEPGDEHQRLTPSATKDLDIVEIAICPSFAHGNLLCVITRTPYSQTTGTTQKKGDQKILFYSIRPKSQVVDYMKLLAAPTITKQQEQEEGEEEQNSPSSSKSSNNNKEKTQQQQQQQEEGEYALVDKPIKTLSIGQEPQCVYFLPDGSHCLVGASEGRIFVIQVTTLAIVKEITYVSPLHHGTWCVSLDSNANSSLVVAAFEVVAPATSKTTTKQQQKKAASASFGSLSSNTPLVVYDVNAFFKETDTFVNHFGIHTRFVRFSPSTTNQKLIATFADNEVVLLDTETSERHKIELKIYGTEFTSVAFSYDGNKLFCATANLEEIEDYYGGYNHAGGNNNNDLMSLFLLVFDVSPSGLAESSDLVKEMEEEKSKVSPSKANRIAHGGGSSRERQEVVRSTVPLLFHLDLSHGSYKHVLKHQIFSMRTIGRHTLLLFDSVGTCFTLALAGYSRPEEEDVAQKPNWLSPPGRSDHPLTFADLTLGTSYSGEEPGDTARGCACVNFFAVLKESAEDFSLVVARGIKNFKSSTTLNQQTTKVRYARDQLSVVKGNQKMSDWMFKRGLFICLKGQSKCSSLLRENWVPLYVTAKFL